MSAETSTESIIGRRVIIRARSDYGSARLLNGLKATICGRHAIAEGWVILHVDENPITPCARWTIDISRLEFINE